MKPPEYTEGPKALENFKQGMKALFKVPKSAVLPEGKQANPPKKRKRNGADKG